MVRDLCGISDKDSITTNKSNNSTLTSEKISKPESPPVRKLRQVTLTPDDVFENQRTSNEFGAPSNQRQLQRGIFHTSVGTIPFEMYNWQYTHFIPQSTLRVLEIVFDLHQYLITITPGFAHPLTYLLHYRTRTMGLVRVLMRCVVNLLAFQLNWTYFFVIYI